MVRVGDRRVGDRVAVGLDVRGASTSCAARGWGPRTAATSGTLLARLDGEGCARYVVTDVTKDGTLLGPNLELLQEVADRTTLRSWRRAGCRRWPTWSRWRSWRRGVEGSIVGKALYAGAFTLPKALAAVRQ